MLSAEASPVLSRELVEAATAIGASNGTDLEMAVVRMRAKLTEAGISDDFGAALTLLDLTAGPGTEKLRAAAGRHAVVLAPHLPEAHLRHAQRLYRDGFESHYWISAFKGYLGALDQPLFLRPLRDALTGPALSGMAIPLFLFLIFLFIRRIPGLSRRYGISTGALVLSMSVACFLIAHALSYGRPAGTLFLPLIAALILPATTRRERWLIVPATFLLIVNYGILTALHNLPPTAPTAIHTAAEFLAFTTPGSIDHATVPYLFHGNAASWLLRHALYAFFFAGLLFLITLITAFALARHRAAFCAACGVPLEPGENARADSDRCIVCVHIAEHQRQIRETEIRRYRDQTAFKRRESSRWVRRVAWMAPGAGLIFSGRVWEGAFYLFGAAGFLWFAAFWIGAADLLALYRPLTTAPAAFCIVSAAALYGVSVARTYLTERHS